MYYQRSEPVTVRQPRAAQQPSTENRRSFDHLNFEMAKNQMVVSNYSAQVPDSQAEGYPVMLNNPSESQLSFNYQQFASNPNLQQNLAHEPSRQTLMSNAPTEGGRIARVDPQHSLTNKSSQSPILINTDSHNLLPTFNNAGYNQIGLISQAPIDGLGLTPEHHQSREPTADLKNSSLGAHAVDSIAGLQNQVINGYQHPVYSQNDLISMQQSL